MPSWRCGSVKPATSTVSRMQCCEPSAKNGSSFMVTPWTGFPLVMTRPGETGEGGDAHAGDGDDDHQPGRPVDRHDREDADRAAQRLGDDVQKEVHEPEPQERLDRGSHEPDVGSIAGFAF